MSLLPSVAMDHIDSTYLLGPREKLAYLDSQKVNLPHAISPLMAWNALTTATVPRPATASTISARMHPEPVR